MIIIRANQPNTMVVTVTQNSELSNPEYLFSFTHIFSKQNVTFIPTDISTHKNRYDEFYFVEGNGAGQIKFPYEGLYLYAIWEQPNGSGNLNPALATNVVENGEAQVLFQSGITMESNYDIWLSPNEENSNIIFAPDEIQPFVPTPSPSLTPTETITPTPSVTQTNTPSVTPSITPSVTQTNTPSVTPSVTQTNTPSVTPSVTQTNTPSVTPSVTQTNTPSITPSVTQTNTPSITPSVTQTNTPSITPSVTQTNTPSITPSVTQTNTASITPSVTQTQTSTLTPTPSVTPEAFTAEYQAIMSRATQLGYEQPSNSEQRRQNQLIKDLKNQGIYQKLGMLYVFSQNIVTVGTPALTFINWITPANTPLSLERGTTGDTFPLYVNYSGWSFNQGNSIRMVSPSTPMSSTVNPINALSGGSWGAYVMSAGTSSTSGNNMLFQSDNNGWGRLQSNNTTNQLLFRGVGLTTNADLTGVGFRAGSLSGALSAVTAVELYSGNTKLSRTKTTTDTAVAGGNMFINGSSSTNRWFFNCGMFFSGLALTETEMNNLNNSFQTYLNTTS